jgi:hypothetical protein
MGGGEVSRRTNKRWKELIDEADYHVESLKVIIASVEQQPPKGTTEIRRTLNYALKVLSANYMNLVDCYAIYRRSQDEGKKQK